MPGDGYFGNYYSIVDDDYVNVLQAPLLQCHERQTQADVVQFMSVELRHFAGLGHEDIASALGITVYLARQKWTYARAWLRNALGDD